MQDSSQEALLLAMAERDTIFEMFDEMFSSDNYHKVLMSYEEGDQYADIEEKLDIGSGTISRAFDELEEHGLLVEDENGDRQHSLPILTHPIIQYYYLMEVIGDE